MKRSYLLIAIVTCLRLISFAQATSLTVDCQTPGWLSSYINPTDIPTLRNLKVTGSINEVDLKAIGNLVKNHNLQGRLDLEDVTIEENKLNSDMFGVTGCSLQYLSLPKSIEKEKLSLCLLWVSLDTLVIGGSQADNVESGSKLYTHDFSDFNVKCIKIREGTQKISFTAGVNAQGSDFNYSVSEFILPESLERIEKIVNFRGLKKMNIPQNIKMLGSLRGTKYYNNSDTLFVPITVTEFWDTWVQPDGYYGVKGYDGTWHDGHIDNLYLPEGLKYLWTSNDGLADYAKVTIHMRSKTPPVMLNGGIGNWCTVYVPEGCKDNYPTSWKKVIEEVLATNIDIEIPQTIHKGDSLRITAKFTPENTTFKDVIWGSEDTSILSISKTGVIHANNCGSTNIKAATVDRYCSTTKEVQVFEHTTGILLDKENLTINIGDLDYLVANTLPLDVSDNQVRWSSSNELIATVDDMGVIRALKQGECIIIVESVDGGYAAQCVVKVKQPVIGVVMDRHNITMNVGQSELLYATASPINADNKKLIWSSTDNSIVDVSNDGNVTAKKCGVTFIKATSVDNPLATDSCKVTVLQPVTGISLNYNTVELHKIGETVQLVATVLPEDASNKEVRWMSSNQSVCMVANGTVVAVGYGTSVIIATTVDGSYMATCTVNVVEGADLPGDVNHDGEVNIADINSIIDIILGGNPNDEMLGRADVNGDGEVNIADINAVIDIILNI